MEESATNAEEPLYLIVEGVRYEGLYGLMCFQYLFYMSIVRDLHTKYTLIYHRIIDPMRSIIKLNGRSTFLLSLLVVRLTR